MEWSGALLARREKDGERHPRWALAPGARALRRALLDGRSRKLLTPLLGCVLKWSREYEMDARSGGLIRAILGRIRASLEGSPLVTPCGLAERPF